MKTTLLFSLIAIVGYFPSFAQSKDHFHQQVNDVQFADYRVFKHTQIVDSLLQQYPNRTGADFFNMTAMERDIKVVTTWRQFKEDFMASIDREAFEFEKRKSSIFFTLHFGPEGQLNHVLFNWLNDLEFPEMTEHFVAFTSTYDFSGFPQGEYWSQCGTIELKRNDLQKAKDQTATD